jgi:hypothetical protein
MAIIRSRRRSGNPDPFFDDVVLYLKGQGADLSTDIIDSSPRPKEITLTGNTAISTAQSKYGTSSILFDGSGDEISAVLDADTFNVRTDPFTLEAWIRLSANNWTLFRSGVNNFYFANLAFDIYVGDGAFNPITALSPNTLNAWQHLAVSFDGTTYRAFRGGVIPVLGGTSNVLLASHTVSELRMGSFLTYDINGYAQYFRATKACRYTADFNPETDTYMS